MFCLNSWTLQIILVQHCKELVCVDGCIVSVSVRLSTMMPAADALIKPGRWQCGAVTADKCHAGKGSGGEGVARSEAGYLKTA